MFKYIIYSVIILIPFVSSAQEQYPNSYKIALNGDTVNRSDIDNFKQGLWVFEQKAVKGEEGFYEYGQFVDDRKNGDWKRFSLDGMMISHETYLDGNKNGEASYYDHGVLWCKGNYLALRSRYKYDTILVEIPDTYGEFEEVVVPTNRGHVRHGMWTFFKSPSQDIERREWYSVDELVEVKNYTSKRDSVYNKQKQALLPHISGKASPNIPKTTKGPVRLTDPPKVISTPSAQRRRK